MTNLHAENAGGKPSRKKQKRSRKPDPTPIPDQQDATEALVDAAIASEPAPPAEITAPPPEEAPAEAHSLARAIARAKTEAAPANPPPSAPVPSTGAPVGLQTIAGAYRDYTRKSMEDARAYVEKLSDARSLGKVMEVQTEFAKQACETFAADSRKIRELYGEYFKQALRLPMSPFDRPRDRQDGSDKG